RRPRRKDPSPSEHWLGLTQYSVANLRLQAFPGYEIDRPSELILEKILNGDEIDQTAVLTQGRFDSVHHKSLIIIILHSTLELCFAPPSGERGDGIVRSPL